MYEWHSRATQGMQEWLLEKSESPIHIPFLLSFVYEYLVYGGEEPNIMVQNNSEDSLWTMFFQF